jgi:predicted P-loop ATPase
MDHIFDPVRDYLDSLVWDGKTRLDRWLVDYCRAADTPLNRAFGRKVLMAAVRRVRTPGCKFDFILVLEGEQGIGKSTMLRILAGEANFSDNEILGLDKREQQEAVQGVWIYEIAELDGIHKSEVTKVKLFASKTVDSARPVYGRSKVDRPRRAIFVATTNEDTYLRDTTGNRRFWPVKVGRIDLTGITRDRDQLWAEAAVAEASGEPLTISEELWSAAADQQRSRMNPDAWEEIIRRDLTTLMATHRKKSAGIDGEIVLATNDNGDPEWRVSTNFLLRGVLTLSPERQGDAVTKRLAGVMRDLAGRAPTTSSALAKHLLAVVSSMSKSSQKLLKSSGSPS